MTTHDAEPETDQGLRRLRDDPRVRELTRIRPPRRPVDASRSVSGAVGAGCALIVCIPTAILFGLASIAGFGTLIFSMEVEALLMLLISATFTAIGALGTRLAWRHLAARRAPVPHVFDPDVRHILARVIGIARREHGHASIVLRYEGGAMQDHEARVGLSAGLTEGDLGVAWLVDDRLVDFVVMQGDETDVAPGPSNQPSIRNAEDGTPSES